jgi:mRNA interferase MazF
MTVDLAPGVESWPAIEPVRGRERGNHRPALIVASAGCLDAVTTLVIVLPITTTDRGWQNHVRVEGPRGLDRPSLIMTEEPGRCRVTGSREWPAKSRSTASPKRAHGWATSLTSDQHGLRWDGDLSIRR